MKNSTILFTSLLCLFLFLSSSSFGQVGLQVGHYRPLGLYAYEFQPQITYGAYWDFTDRNDPLRLAAGIEVISLKPWIEQYPRADIMGSTLYFGSLEWKQYDIWNLGFIVDYCLLAERYQSFIYPTVGLDAFMSNASYEYVNDGSFINTDARGGSTGVEVALKLGFNLRFFGGKVEVWSGMARAYGVMETPEFSSDLFTYSVWKPYSSILIFWH